MKTLFVTDLDGTLLNSDVAVSSSSADMLNRAIEAGAPVSVATARTPATLAHLLKDVHFKLPLVVMTGAALWDRSANSYRDVAFFSPEKVREIRNIYQQFNLPSFIYTLRDGLLHIYHQGPMSDRERSFVLERVDSPYKRFHIADRQMASQRPDYEGFKENADHEIPNHIDNAILFFGMQRTERDHPAYDALRSLGGFNPMIYPDANTPEITMIEAFPPHASKANGIHTLRNLCGADRVVVFGDNLNDLSMFETADIAVAVDNALPEVKKKADIIIESHNHDAVARFILDVTLGNISLPNS